MKIEKLVPKGKQISWIKYADSSTKDNTTIVKIFVSDWSNFDELWIEFEMPKYMSRGLVHGQISDVPAHRITEV